MLHSLNRDRPVALLAKPLLLLAIPVLLLAGCAPYRYADRSAGGDPYGADMRIAAEARVSSRAQGERHRRAVRVARKVKLAASPILSRNPILTEVDKALTKPARSAVDAPLSAPASAAAGGAPQTFTESSVTVSSASPSGPIKSPTASVATRTEPPTEQMLAFPNATKSKLVEQGRSLFRAGQVTKARERFMAALVELAPGRVPEVLPDLARTYDPYYLQQLAKSDVKPNAAMALAIYQRASLTGKRAHEADIERLERERERKD